MSDYGDFCREQRERRQRLRFHWHACPHCERRFGTGTLVPPGGRCRHDGWQAPGKHGDDERAAWGREETRQERLDAEKPHKCPSCGKRFSTVKAQNAHAKAKRCERLPIKSEVHDDEIPF